HRATAGPCRSPLVLDRRCRTENGCFYSGPVIDTPVGDRGDRAAAVAARPYLFSAWRDRSRSGVCGDSNAVRRLDEAHNVGQRNFPPGIGAAADRSARRHSAERAPPPWRRALSGRDGLGDVAVLLRTRGDFGNGARSVYGEPPGGGVFR